MKKLYLQFLAVSAVTLEWVEFSVYMYMSTFLAKIFFPIDDAEFAYIYTMAIFAMSYLVRPLGAIIYGYVADKRGRKKVMVLSVFLMSIATIAIGFLPTYNQAGYFAPLALLFFRMLQGFAIAIEFNNAGIYIIEHSKRSPIIASAFVSAAASFGMCCGAFIDSIINLENTPDIWRMPFIILGIASFFIYFLRRSLTETPDFENIRKSNAIESNPFRKIFKEHKLALFKIFATASFIGCFLYGGHIYLVSIFLVKHGGYTIKSANELSFYTNLLLSILTPIFAYIGSRFNLAQSFFRIGIIGIAAIGPFLFLTGYLGPNFKGLMSFVFAFYAIADALFACYIYYYLFSLLPANIRCSGIGFGYSSAIAIIGGTAPLVFEFLVKNVSILAPGLIVTFFGLSLVFIIDYQKNLTQSNLEAGRINRPSAT